MWKKFGEVSVPKVDLQIDPLTIKHRTEKVDGVV